MTRAAHPAASSRAPVRAGRYYRCGNASGNLCARYTFWAWLTTREGKLDPWAAL